jgi:ABC-type transport system involved in cytochrome c biogenesis permease component
MKILGNPFIAEDLSASFTRTSALRSYPGFIAVMAVVILIWWPRGPFTTYLRAGTVPDSFTAAALGLLACAAYLSARFGAEDFAEESASRVQDFVTLTPVPVSSVVAGKMAASAVHTIFILVLGLPFLLLGSAVNGTSIPVIARAALVSGSSAFCFRAFAFLCFTLFGPYRLLKNSVIFLCGLAFLTASTAVIPALSPISAILSLNGLGSIAVLGRTVPFYLVSVIIGVSAAALFFAAAGAWLRILRKRYVKKQLAAASGAEARAKRLLKGLWNEGTDDVDGSG